jgi:hypothetical protein
MRQKMIINDSQIEENQLILKTDSQIDLSLMVPNNQMLVDSDGAAFIYITEDNEDYTYIALPESVWEHLKQAMEAELPVFLVSGDSRLELTGIYEELAYLIANIEGNSNYGEEFVSKVEKIFIK